MLRFPAVLLLLTTFVVGCETTPGDTLFDPDREVLPAPSVNSVDPEENWLGGVGEITIFGSEFHPDPDMNLVYFDDRRATVILAEDDRLVIETPNYVAEDAVLRVTTIGAREYSNVLSYRLDPAVAVQPGLPQSDQAVAMTYGDGRVYASTTTGGLPSGVRYINIAEGSGDRYAEPRNWQYTDLAYDEDTDMLYIARGATPIIYRVPPGGGEDEAWLTRGGLGRVATLTLDDAGNIWAAGNNQEIYRVTQEQEVTPFPFDANVRAIVFAGDALYAAATSGDDINGAWRIPLTATGEAGQPELIFDAGQEVGGSALSIEVGADGTVFVGTDATEGIVQVNPDGSWEALHPGLLSSSVIALSFGEASANYEGNILYALHDPSGDQANQLLRIESLTESR